MTSTGKRDQERLFDAAAAQHFYDRFGTKQDSQGFYENRALDDLVAHGDFQHARSVFEFGCGTGKFAARLLEKHLSPSASYLGCDVSPVMVGLAKRRVEAYGARAQVVLSDGAVRFPLPAHSVDRVVATYVLDLLSPADIERFFSESRRVMMPGGKVCISSLTLGINVRSRVISSFWAWVFRLNPALVGGCRPIDVASYVNPNDWEVVHRRAVTPFGVPSEILIIEMKDAPGEGRGLTLPADGHARSQRR